MSSYLLQDVRFNWKWVDIFVRVVENTGEKQTIFVPHWYPVLGLAFTVGRK